MELSYYPGCSLHGTSEEYEESIRAVFAGLEVPLHELEDWTCCGASSAHVMNDRLAHLLAARNLVLAERAGKDVLVPCAMCFSRLKFAEKAGSTEIRRWTENQTDQHPVEIVSIHDLLVKGEVLNAIRAKITKPLAGLKAVPYYGCLTVRPPKIVDADRPEDPVALDEILAALGAEVIPWSFKTDCCGGSFSLSKPEVVRKLSGDLMEAAQHAGADCFVADCPMCQANLDSRQAEIAAERTMDYRLPVFFITELITLAWGMDKESNKWFSKHLVDPRPVLKERGLS